MGQRWRKLGRVYVPDAGEGWPASHAANPFAVPLDDRTARVFFGGRDPHNRTAIGWLDLEVPALRITASCPGPVLEPGEPGTFDDSGCSMGCVVVAGDRWYLYYLGWNLGVTVPWRNAIGLAMSEDGGSSFTRISPAPILDRHACDPFTLSYPAVIRDGGRWRMWYGSHLHWRGGRETIDHVIKAATSDDGIDWRRDGRPCIVPDEVDRAFARPSVVRDADRYRMWYSVRGERYRIGYAESVDGASWQRLDAQAGIAPGPEPWDDAMLAYPHVFDMGGSRYMLYNGNDYGRTGFGLAVLEGS